MNPVSKPALRKSQTQSIQPITEGIPVQDLFDKQRAYFGRDVTKTYEWRVDQLDRLIRVLKENYGRLADASRKDFKTAARENIFEVSASIANQRIRQIPTQRMDRTGRNSSSKIPHSLEHLKTAGRCR